MKHLTAIRCIAFYKGDQLADWLLEYLINAASRGKITEAGRRLHLIPIHAYENARRKQQEISDAEVRRLRKRGIKCSGGSASPRIRYSDCIPLTSFLPRNDQELEQRLLQISEFGPLFSVCSDTVNVTPVHGIGPESNRNAKCAVCSTSLAGRRHGTKYCSSACKQVAYRAKEKV
jgi:hypothetical protein